jgi:hypothetical protein
MLSKTLTVITHRMDEVFNFYQIENWILAYRFAKTSANVVNLNCLCFMFNSRDSNRFSHHQFTSTNIFTDHTKSSCHNCTIVKPSDQGFMSLNIYGNIFQEK